MAWTLRNAALLFAAVLWPGALLAGAIDPHAVFEERCSRCHTEHAGAFTRKALTLREDGQLYGKKTGRRLSDFLIGHPGSALPDEIAALLDMFAMQSRSGGVYESKCGVCHTSAKRLARVRLELKDGRLVDRVTGRDIPRFLADHGRVDAGEIEILTRMLTWQIRTSGR